MTHDEAWVKAKAERAAYLATLEAQGQKLAQELSEATGLEVTFERGTPQSNPSTASSSQPPEAGRSTRRTLSPRSTATSRRLDSRE